ncbi:MAG: AgmX/PglI C-terminal domain-containing protein, partial [Bacteriovoracaceae bacterium]
KIFSVDYLPEGNNLYQITGLKNSHKDIEFPYLGKKDKYPFITLKKSQMPVVHTLPGFTPFFLSDDKKQVGEEFELGPQDILRLYNGDLQIFVRGVESPPKVAPAPILKRDPDFQKYLFFLLLFVGLVAVGFNVIELPEPEVKEELAPERLATILYKQPLTISKNKAVEKTEKAPKRAQKAPDKPAVEKKVVTKKQPDVKKPDVVETKVANKKPDPGTKTAQTKQVVKQGTTPPKRTAQKAAPQASNRPAARTQTATARNAPAVSQVATKSVGQVEVYKSADFKSTVSSLVAKGGTLSGVQTKAASGASGTQIGAASGVAGGSGSIETADIATNQGSLVGATVGKLGESIGAEGLSAKRAIYQAGIPAETVVLGSMDPDVIRRILMDNIIHFRSCYQNELSTRGQEFSGSVKLNFTIGASGHVSQAGVDGSSSLPAGVKRCVVNVLRGIAFPAPMGGGVVEVKQPMNFYPKKI